jgi:uncharacterized protein (TIGR02001 family)
VGETRAPDGWSGARRPAKAGVVALANIAAGVLLMAGLLAGSRACRAADGWGGSVDVTSDYLVRGISRSDDHAAAQLDLHYLDGSGAVAGMFVSNSQIDPYASRGAEVNGYAGYTWSAGSDWRGKILAGYYGYPGNADGSRYNYAEVDLDVAYQQWLHAACSYFPDARRYLPSGALIHVNAVSAELNLQRPILGKLSGTAGIGYYDLGEPQPTGYAYWSAGAAYDLSSVSLAVSFVDASSAAKSLFYNAATGGRWTGTILWRF